MAPSRSVCVRCSPQLMRMKAFNPCHQTSFPAIAPSYDKKYWTQNDSREKIKLPNISLKKVIKCIMHFHIPLGPNEGTIL